MQATHARKSSGEQANAIGPVEFEEQGDKIIVSAELTEPVNPQERGARFVQVFTVRDGRIVDIQDCRDKRAAQRFARSR